MPNPLYLGAGARLAIALAAAGLVWGATWWALA
jgi:hypothetical protein